MGIIKEIVITKKVFDIDKIKIGDKVFAQRLLSCEILPNGKRVNKRYDLSECAIVTDIYNEDAGDLNPTKIDLEFSFGIAVVCVEDILDEQWEISVLK